MQFHIDRGDGILHPLLDRDRDDIAALRRVELGVGAHDVKIGISVLEIEPADKFEVGGDPVGIVDVRRLEEREVIHLRRLHEIAQLAGGIDLIADEIDRLHAGLFAFVDGEDDIEPAIWQIDGPGRDRWPPRGRNADKRP